MNHKQKWHAIAYSSWAVELVVLAREYCAKWSGESARSDSEKETAAEVMPQDWLYAFLGLLFYKMSRVPNLQHTVAFDELGDSLSELEYEHIRQVAADALESIDTIAFELSEEEGQIYQGEPRLSEIVADLYQELYELLVHYNDGEEHRMTMALARCQYYFLLEWGTKLLLGLRWLQTLRAERLLRDEEQEGEKNA